MSGNEASMRLCYTSALLLFTIYSPRVLATISHRKPSVLIPVVISSPKTMLPTMRVMIFQIAKFYCRARGERRFSMVKILGNVFVDVKLYSNTENGFTETSFTIIYFLVKS